MGPVVVLAWRGTVGHIVVSPRLLLLDCDAPKMLLLVFLDPVLFFELELVLSVDFQDSP